MNRHEAAQAIKDAAAAFGAGGGHRQLQNHGAEMDGHAHAVLSRLGQIGRNSDRLTAAEAIVDILPRESWDLFFADCILAERRSRQHAKSISDAQQALERSAEGEKALRLVMSVLGWKPDQMSRNDDPVGEAFAILSISISMKKQIATRHLKLSSRKKTPDAARGEGVAWIRESLKMAIGRLGHKAEPRHAAAIATAVLNMGEVTEDAARKTRLYSERLGRLP